ncbi:MAG: ABC transporter ATP-binding protein [Actinomycetaceae bacterium]|nr:ABC transporter ATP-binding protein [Actinomycetaceae bacterium]
MLEENVDTQAPVTGPGSVADGGVSIRGLELDIVSGKGRKEILRGISLDAPEGSITGVAGESGSGKTMTGMTVCGLQPKHAHMRGHIWFKGIDLLQLSPRELNKHRGVDIAMVFQDPTASLHPMLTIERQMTDHMRFHLGCNKKEARAKAIELLEEVKVPHASEALDKYPHQFSGGQLQRIAIASALAANPSVLIADEPTTALDVTVQAGILRLLRQLCDHHRLAIILVTHDLGVMSSLADTIAVLRYGEVVEYGERQQIICKPEHRYTRDLIESLPQHRPPLTKVKVEDKPQKNGDENGTVTQGAQEDD